MIFIPGAYPADVCPGCARVLSVLAHTAVPIRALPGALNVCCPPSWTVPGKGHGRGG
ncbi:MULTISPECIES: hypothetical protein [unclassified Streptomyces]|uniref:hypothetical protein n=1 Tax=unclassified Streptomyces TaxID=2593676 RepID=UPI001301407E|nr:hypothetical protein [Streptomyces sp. CB01580]